jgi:NADPH-dependent 2,4-dienoyl-CoA reductase/sulfur reductase-like enzyme
MRITRSTPHVIIIGAGFAGLYAALSLAKANVRITIVDRRNHHTFQPLLYQVATAALSPGEIAYPIRHIFRDKENISVLLTMTGTSQKGSAPPFRRRAGYCRCCGIAAITFRRTRKPSRR